MKEQIPSKQNNWLYKDSDNKRIFTKLVLHCNEDEAWPECTDAEKQAWEEAHKPEEPQQAEEQATE